MPLRPDEIDAEESLSLGETVTAESGDVCRVGSWVFYRSPTVCHFFSGLLPCVLG
jgi:hypothetical protein